MERGDLVVAALPGDYGKPRPALVVQADVYSDTMAVVVLPMTSEVGGPPGPRIRIEPSDANSLRIPSRVMVDKPGTILRAKLGGRIGKLSSSEMTAVDRALALFLGFA